MLRIHVLAVAAGVLALAAAAPSVQAKAGGKKHHGLHGVVMSIAKDGSSITIQSGGKKNKKTGMETQVVTQVIKLGAATTYTKMSPKAGAVKGEKNALEANASTFDRLKVGHHVSIEVKDGVATEVKFHGHHKKAA